MKVFESGELLVSFVKMVKSVVLHEQRQNT